ncbi:MAG: FAD-binding oxidoreductase [Alphaproteobacteria bacterium]|nr:FAD-binding oxidoreductase [Alphaproteobacteria bacterium]
MIPDKHDLIVVGAGIAGLATAYFYKCQFPNHSVLVLDRKGTGAGLSGRSGGHRMPGFEADYSELVKLLGEDKALELYRETIETSKLTDAIIAREKIKCGARHGYWIVDEQASEFSKLDEFMRPRRALGIPEPEFHEGAALKKFADFNGYNVGLHFPDIASFDTPKFIYGLADAFVKRGGIIAEGSEYDSHEPLKRSSKKHAVILTTGQMLQTDKLVLAGGDILSRQIEFLHHRTVTVYTGRIAVRLAKDDFKRISPNAQPLAGCDSDLKSNQNPLEGDFLWFSLRSDGYLAMGFGGCFGSPNHETTEKNIADMIADVRRELFERLPFLANGHYRIKPTVGGLNTSSNLLPIVGSLTSEEGVHFIAAQSGVGLNQSMLIAKSLVDSFKGDRRIHDMLLQFHRTQVLIPTHPRLRQAAVKVGILETSSKFAAVRGACHVAHGAAQLLTNAVRPAVT